MARIVAKALNCTDLRDGEPCDRCEACVAIREGRALDVIEMDAASHNKVEDMREFLPRVATGPSDLRRKVFIVDEVQRITQGWDLLLKTLEEPPDHVAFIFCTTDASQVRPAVLSRVQRFDFRPLHVPQIEGKLRRVLAAEGREGDDDAVTLVARLAAGGMRDAESMLDQLLSSGTERLTAAAVRELLGIVDAETVDGFIDALVRGDALAGLRLLQDLEDRGRDLRSFLNQVVDRLREQLVARLTDPKTPGPTVDQVAAAARRLAGIDPTRTGPGGLRFQLELALLAPGPGAPMASQRTPRSPTPRPRRASTRTSSPRHGRPSPAAQPPRGPAPVVCGRARPTSRRPRSWPLLRRRSLRCCRPPRSPHRRRRSPLPAPTGPAEPAPPAAPPSERARVTPAAVVEGRSAEPQPLALETQGPPGLDDLLRRWPDIVAHVSKGSPATRPLIVVCRPIAVDGNIVTLGFPESQAFLKDVAERRRPILEEGVGRFLGHAVTVRCVATNVELPEPVPADPDADRLLVEARRIFGEDLVDIGEVS